MKLNRIVRLAAPLVLATSSLLSATSSLADVHVGVVLSLTGPGASVGIPEQNAIKLWPAEIAGQKLVISYLNDDSDPTTASKNTSKLVNEDNVDVIVGSSLTPTSLAMVQVAAQARTAMVSLAGGSAIVEPMDERKRWAFRLGAPEKFSTELVADDVKRHNGTSIGVIALSSAYGEGFLKAMQASAGARGLKIVSVERFNLSDQSVTAQVAKLAALNPDAIYIAAAGTSGALPQIELANRGYKGRIYQTSGVANSDFLRVAGKSAEGTYITVLPLLVAEQLKETDALRKPSLAFVRSYEGKYGPGTRSGFAASASDTYYILENAIEYALTKAQPGTPEFRAAVRDGIERTKDLPTTTLVFSFSGVDHSGLDQRSQVLARIQNGKWVLAD